MGMDGEMGTISGSEDEMRDRHRMIMNQDEDIISLFV